MTALSMQSNLCTNGGDGKKGVYETIPYLNTGAQGKRGLDKDSPCKLTEHSVRGAREV